MTARDKVFADNLAYATTRLIEFSADRQFQLWTEVEAYVMREMPKVYNVCALSRGGAAGSSLNVHKALCQQGYDSMFVTRDNTRLSPFIPNILQLSPELSFDYDHAQIRSELRPRYTIFSIDDYAISNETLYDIFKDADLINFTWFTQFISLENIRALAGLGKPITITLRDMNPLTGGCHYFHGCNKWQSDCDDCPQLVNNDDNFPHFVMRSKLEGWPDDTITFIALSDHSLSILEKSSLAQGKRIEKISNFVDGDVFFCEDRHAPREEFNFADDEFVIGYLPSFNSIVKGHDYVLPILKRLAQLRPDLKFSLALAADSFPDASKLPCPLHTIGAINGNDKLRRYYNAVDAVIVPSLEETFSNTTVEALACGAPVVGFRTGILEEILRDERLGDAVPIGDVEAFAQGLARLADGEIDRALCSEFVLSAFSKERQAQLYDQLFRSLLADKYKDSALSKGENLELVQLREALGTRLAARKAVGAQNRLTNLNRKMRHEIAIASKSATAIAGQSPLMLLARPTEMIGDLRLPDDVHRDTAGHVAIPAVTKGHAAFGPYYRLKDGRYRGNYRMRASVGSAFLLAMRASWLVAECCTAPNNIVAGDYIKPRFPGSRRIEGMFEFDVPESLDNPGDAFEFRVTSGGKLAIVFESVVITKMI